jgi:hypothetical protein
MLTDILFVCFDTRYGRYTRSVPKGATSPGGDPEDAKRRKVQREMEKLRDACGTGHRYYSYTHDQQSRHPLKQHLAGFQADDSNSPRSDGNSPQ